MPNSRMANAGLSGLQRRPCGIIRIAALCPLCRHRHKGHATGHPSRLNRPDLGTPFGSEAYAREELRAEIASLMIADKLGIGHDPGQHAAYVGSWINPSYSLSGVKIAVLGFGRAYALRFIVAIWVRDLACVGG